MEEQWRSTLNQTDQDQRLGGAAREAKERLDERLRTHTNCDFKRYRFEFNQTIPELNFF